MIEWLEQQPVLRDAARMARIFHLDPISVLDASLDEWLIRVAASNVVAEDEKKASK